MSKKEKIIMPYKENKSFKNHKILFGDLETIIDKEGVHTPIVVAFVESKNKQFLFNSIDTFMLYLIKECKKSIIYFHNFGRFDSTFILKWISNNKPKCGAVEVIERDNVIYQIKLKKHQILFRDSFLVIPVTLKEIGETYCSNYQKDNFEYGRMNEIWKENPKLVRQLCINDCLVLMEGFLKFSKIIEKKFHINVFSYITLPSISLNIYKHSFYDHQEKPIGKNLYEIDKFIRSSYAGGISEVFAPSLKNGYCYDANSLYPFAMMKNKYPIGKGKMVKKEEIILDEFIGFLECIVSCDKEINFLTYRCKKRGLITPKGVWKAVYFHEEVKQAIKLGYEIEIVRGCKYEKEGYLFKEFVKNLYQMRKNSKNKSENQIIKLVMNSLYGRFGMKLFTEETKFISADQIKEVKKSYKIKNIHYIGNNLYSLVVVKRNETPTDLYKNTVDVETAVQIASAVTAYARIYMFKFKTLKNNKCYYTDTDSIFLKKPLEKNFIGEELGMFKLEYQIKKGYFIAPKVYYIDKTDGEEKIVLKGLKKEETNRKNVIESFEKVIDNKDHSFIISRVNNFKRDLLSLTTFTQEMKIQFNFPFNKRKKIIRNNKWIGTEALKIKNLSS